MNTQHQEEAFLRFLDMSRVRATKASEMDGTVLLGKVKAVNVNGNEYTMHTLCKHREEENRRGRKQKMQKVNRNTRMSLPLGKRES